MRKSMLWTFVLVLIPLRVVNAQTWESDYQQLCSSDEIESEAWEENCQLLSELEQHPINLNAATREQLEQLPFLTAQEIEEICAYLYRYAPMRSLGELAMIESLDATKRRLLRHFVYLGEKERGGATTVWNKHPVRQELLVTGRIPFYQRRGDRNGYLGDRYRHQLRYSLRRGDQLSVGLVAAQDAGEPFFAQKNRFGYDYYSLYLQMKDVGRFKTIVVGNYRLSAGMGLVVNSDFLLGKTAALAALGRSRQVLRPHSSTTADRYLLGGAATLQLLPALQLTPFLSYRPLDGTVNSDSMSISSIVTGGYHRTIKEMEKKNNTWQTTLGMNLSCRFQGFHAGLTIAYQHLSRELRPNKNVLYRYYYPAGKDFMNIGIDYGFASHRLAMNGETAINRQGALATIHIFSWNLSQEVSVLALQRFYGMKYTSLLAQSISEGGRTQNESGFYLGSRWQPSRKLSLSAYADIAYFAWPRYQVSAASYAHDYLVDLSYQPSAWSFSARYRLRVKEKDAENHAALVSRQEHRGRLWVSYQGSKLQSKTQLDGVGIRQTPHRFGYAVSQQLSYPLGKLFHAHLSAAYFHTDDYDSRLYVYEQGMLYQSSFSALSGQGVRCAFLLKAQVASRLAVNVRAAMTNYFDRSAIGSGYQEVARSSMTDLDLQLKWKF